MNKNGVEIKGLLDESMIKNLNYIGTVIYSEIDYIFISKRNYPIINLNSISIEVEVLNEREITLNDTSIISIDGVKKFTIEYLDDQHKKIILNKSVPFNSFFEVPKNTINYTGFKINILDAFFHGIDEFTIYSYLNYLITIEGTPLDANPILTNTNNINIKNDLNTETIISEEKEALTYFNKNLDETNSYSNFATNSSKNTNLETIDSNNISKKSTIDKITQSIPTDDAISITTTVEKNLDLDEEFM